MRYIAVTLGNVQRNHTVRFNKAVIPEDAILLDINTINIADASERIACAVIIHVRLKKIRQFFMSANLQ